MRAAALIAGLMLAGCVHRPALYGSYTALGPAREPMPAVTMEIARPDRYTLCQAGQCASGRWTLANAPGDCDGRITFQGAAMEALVRRLATADGPSPVWRQRGTFNEVDLDYRACADPPSITLGTGDAALVRR